MEKRAKFHFIIQGVLFIALIAFDQFTKVLACNHLKGNESVIVIDNIFSLTYVENEGAAWGVLSGRVNILMIVTLLLMPLFAYIFIRAHQAKKIMPEKTKIWSGIMYIMVFLLAGAIGNFIDRLVNGYVVDFFEATFIDFPVFNVADCYITVGEIVFCIVVFFLLKEDEFDILIRGKKAVKDEEIDG